MRRTLHWRVAHLDARDSRSLGLVEQRSEETRAEALERHRQERHAGGSCDCRVIVVCQREE